jgi:hypothetical protein
MTDVVKIVQEWESTMKRRRKSCGVVLFFALAFLSGVAIRYFLQRGPSGRKMFDDRVCLRDGDIVLIQSKTWRSFFLDVFSSDEENFSHAGIIKKIKADYNVIHATPDNEFLTMEPFAIFVSPKKTGRSMILRFRGKGDIPLKASRNALKYYLKKVPFDEQFDISNEDKLYCTELVWLSYKRAGFDFITERNLLLDSVIFGKILLPSALIHCDDFEIIWQNL